MTDTQPFEIIPVTASTKKSPVAPANVFSTRRQEEPSKQTALIVDPDVAQRHLATIFLGELGYKVLESKTESAAMELARTNALSILITRLGLPSCDGPTLARRLRQISPRIRVLYTSVCPFSEVRQQYGSLIQADSFVQSPFSIDSLNDALVRSTGK